MVALKAGQVDAFVSRPDPKTRAILIYGPDTGLVSERARALARHVVSDLDDPFNVARLDDGMLSADPGRLADEAQAQSLMGGRRVVWVSNGASAAAAAAERYLEAPRGDALILVEAGELRPSARLRKVFEQAKEAAALPCYADDARTIDALVSSELARHGLEITPPARERLLSLLGADRQLTRNELEKLCLYMHGRETVDEEDVEAICGDAAAYTIDELVDAAAEGDVERADRAFARLQAAGIGVTPVALELGRHLIRLQALLASGGGGRNPEQAVRGARPPFPFGRVRSVVRQLGIWSDADLRRMITAVSELEAETRGNADLADTLLGRTLVGMAHNARAIRARRN